MPQIGIAAQLYTLRSMLRTPEEIASTLKKVKEIGYDAVQLSGLGPIDTHELKKILDGEGLEACATHIPMNRLLNETDGVIEEHKILNCKYTSCPFLPLEYHNEAGFKKAARQLSNVGKRLKEADIVLTYHNHGFEFEKFDFRTGLEILYHESDAEYLQGEIDTYWVQYGGGDPAKWCLQLKNRLPLVHLKDMGIKDNKQIMMEVGEGNLNWEAIMSACKKAGTSWYIIEQDICQRPALESLKISLENVKRMLKV